MIHEEAEGFLAELEPMRPLLGLDMGTKTIGVAISDALLTVASPLEVIRRKKFKLDAAPTDGITTAVRLRSRSQELNELIQQISWSTATLLHEREALTSWVTKRADWCQRFLQIDHDRVSTDVLLLFAELCNQHGRPARSAFENLLGNELLFEIGICKSKPKAPVF